MMKERPILFNSEMVRAILDGMKTQTRRVIRPVPEWEDEDPQECEDAKWADYSDWHRWHFSSFDHVALKNFRKCPYGKTGDHLWVRETFRIGAWERVKGASEPFGYKFAFDYKASPELNSTPWIHCSFGDGDEYENQSINDFQKAEIKGHPLVWRDGEKELNWERGHSPCRWRPSIHMPRWASRIQLKITDVRVERVQEITGADVLAEGIRTGTFEMAGWQYINEFKDLWNSINKKRGYGWNENPWVWVVEFERIKP